MKKLFALILFACVALFSGVILSSCGENDGQKTIVISDASGLCDVRIKTVNNGSDTYLQSNRGVFHVPNHSNLKVEINAGGFGVDFSDLKVVVNGKVYEKDVNLFDTNRQHDKYSPIPDVGNLYYGYFTIPYIENDVTVRLLNVKKVVTTFAFEVEDLEKLEESEVKLKQTQINVSNTEEEDFVSLYDFVTGENNTLTREFDLTAEPERNFYRTFHLKFDGIAPFAFNYGCPFQLFSGEDEIDLNLNDNLIRWGDEYILDLGAKNVGAEAVYTIKVDFSKVDYRVFNIKLPQDNQIYSINSSSSSVTVEDIDSCVFDVTKNITEAANGVVVNYDNMQILANGTPLVEKDGHYVFPEELKTPNQAEIARDWFDISVTGITYTKGEETLEPIVLNASFSDTVLTQTSMSAQFGGLDDDGQNKKVFGVNEEGLPFALEGQTCVLSWDYMLDVDINKYRTYMDLKDVAVMLNNVDEPLFNLKDILPEDNSSLQDNIFTYTKSIQVQTSLEVSETREYTLKAKYNTQTGVFDHFDLQFPCHIDATEFEFIVKEYIKNIDVSSQINDDQISVRCALFNQNDEMTSENWRDLGGDAITFAVSANQIVAFEIIVDQNNFLKPSNLIVEDEILGAKYNDGEDFEVEGGKRGFIIKFIISNIYLTSNAPFTLITAV